MNTRQMEYIITIASERNMQRAAQKMFVSQSTLSQTLGKLEKELNCQLFTRDIREMIPTKAGEVYIRAAKEMLEIKKEAYEEIARIANVSQKKYRIGISSQEGMDRFLIASGHLQKAYKDIDIHAIEDNFDGLLEKLMQKKLTFAITTCDSFHQLLLPHKVLKREEIKLVTPENWHPRGLEFCPNEVSWQQLEQERLILPLPKSTIRTMVDKELKQYDVRPIIAIEVGSAESTLRFVRQGNGISYLPESLLKDKTGYFFLSMKPKLIRHLVVIYNEGIDEDPIVRRFMELLMNVE